MILGVKLLGLELLSPESFFSLWSLDWGFEEWAVLISLLLSGGNLLFERLKSSLEILINKLLWLGWMSYRVIFSFWINGFASTRMIFNHLSHCIIIHKFFRFRPRVWFTDFKIIVIINSELRSRSNSSTSWSYHLISSCWFIYHIQNSLLYLGFHHRQSLEVRRYPIYLRRHRKENLMILLLAHFQLALHYYLEHYQVVVCCN